MTLLNTLPPSQHNPDPKECILAREVYEYACFMSIETGEIPNFEWNFNTLKFYYNELKGIIPES